MSRKNLIIQPQPNDQKFLITDQVAVFQWTRKSKRIDNIWWNVSAIILFGFTTLAIFHLTVIGQFLDDVFFNFIFGGVFKYLIYLILYTYVVFIMFGIKIKIKRRVFFLLFVLLFLLCLVLSDVFLIVDYKTNWRHEKLPIISADIFLIIMRHFIQAWFLGSVFHAHNLNFFFFNTSWWFNYHIAGGILSEFAVAVLSYLSIFFPLGVVFFGLLSWGGIILQGNAFWYLGIKKLQGKKLTIAVNHFRPKKGKKNYENVNLLSEKYLSRHVMFFDASADIIIDKVIPNNNVSQTNQEIIEDLDLLNDNFLENEGAGGDLTDSHIKDVGLGFHKFSQNYVSTNQQTPDDPTLQFGSGFFHLQDDKSQYIVPRRWRNNKNDKNNYFLFEANEKKAHDSAMLWENIKLQKTVEQKEKKPKEQDALSHQHKSTLVLGKKVQPARTSPSVVHNDRAIKTPFAEETITLADQDKAPEVMIDDNGKRADQSLGSSTVFDLRNKIGIQAVQTMNETNFKSFQNAVYRCYPQHLLKKSDFAKLKVLLKKNQDIARQNALKINVLLNNFKIDSKIARWFVLPLTTIFTIRFNDQRYNHSNLDSLKSDFENVLRQKTILYFDETQPSTFIIEAKNHFLTYSKLGDYVLGDKHFANKYLIKLWLGKDLEANNVTCLFGDLLRSMILLASDWRTTLHQMHVIIVWILIQYKPHQLKLVLVDLTKKSFLSYQGLPHLLTPIIDDHQNLIKLLNIIKQEVKNRKNLLVQNQVKHMRAFNEKNTIEKRLPLWFIVINYPKATDQPQIHYQISYLLQTVLKLLPTVGIYLVLNTNFLDQKFLPLTLFTQFNYLIQFAIWEADFPSWLNYKNPLPLLPFTYFYFQSIDANYQNELLLVNGVFVTQSEIENIVDYTRRQQKTNYNPLFHEITSYILERTAETRVNYFSTDDENLYQEIIAYLKKNKKISTFLLQSTFSIGYKKAQLLIKRLQQDHYVSCYQSDQSLIVLI